MIDVVPGWVTAEAAWPAGFDPALAERLDRERETERSAFLPSWLRNPAAGMLAIELLSGASEAYECAGWSQCAIDMFVAEAKKSLTGPIDTMKGHGCDISAEWIATIGRLCVAAGGWPVDLQSLGHVPHYLFEPTDPPMVWETETTRREAVIRKQIDEIERMAPPFGNDRKRSAAQRTAEPWLRMLLLTHGEDRATARRIDRGEP